MQHLHLSVALRKPSWRGKKFTVPRFTALLIPARYVRNAVILKFFLPQLTIKLKCQNVSPAITYLGMRSVSLSLKVLYVAHSIYLTGTIIQGHHHVQCKSQLAFRARQAGRTLGGLCEYHSRQNPSARRYLPTMIHLYLSIEGIHCYPLGQNIRQHRPNTCHACAYHYCKVSGSFSSVQCTHPRTFWSNFLPM